MNKLNMLMWFLRRPSYYPHLIRVVAKKFTPGASARDRTSQEATRWCIDRSVPRDAAFRRLTGGTLGIDSWEKCADRLAAAENVAATCPVKMGGPGEMALLYVAAEYLGAERVIETGVAYGWSSLAILLSLQNRLGSRLVSSDMPYPGRRNDEYVGCVVPGDLRGCWTLLRYPDRVAMPYALRLMPTIDLCHYDSDKSYDGRMWTYSLLWKALRPAGWFISDDIADNLAFRDFALSVAAEPVVVNSQGKYVGVLVKPGDWS